MSPSSPETSSPFGKRMLVWTFVAVLAAPAFFLTMRVISTWRSGYSWAEMDWNGDGQTSLGDFLRAAEIAKRRVKVNGVICWEYFGSRDGGVVKTDCPR